MYTHLHICVQMCACACTLTHTFDIICLLYNPRRLLSFSPGMSKSKSCHSLLDEPDNLIFSPFMGNRNKFYEWLPMFNKSNICLILILWIISGFGSNWDISELGTMLIYNIFLYFELRTWMWEILIMYLSIMNFVKEQHK